jgi:hypothetical protein
MISTCLLLPSPFMYTRTSALFFSCTRAHAHTHTHSNTVTLSLATYSHVAVLAITKAAHLICIVLIYVLQLISLLISQATQVHHITVNGGAFSAAFLYSRLRQSLNLHMHTLDTTQLSTFILSAIILVFRCQMLPSLQIPNAHSLVASHHTL